MTTTEVDPRNPERRANDERIAAEPKLEPLEQLPDAPLVPLEVHLGRYRQLPLAVVGIVENGLVRPLDPAIKLQEHSQDIIVAAEGT